MIRGLYTAASGMLSESLRTDTIANNLANVDTTGYKKDVAVSKDFRSMLLERVNDGENSPVIGSIGVGALIDEIRNIHSEGPTVHTGNTLDFAITGKGYFTVQTPNGVRYTRNGSFTKNAAGDLVTSDGYPVLGQNGPIRLNGTSVNVSTDGQIQVDDVALDSFRLVDFADTKELTKEGSSLFNATQAARNVPADGAVQQGYLEKSNVNVVMEMVNLINGYRTYETNAKAVQAEDELLDKAVNEVAKV